ncbi:deoxynucleoside kinase [Candidatus Woesearchaeota archaeon]|nr:deoxynucleoside kinase [Candidatus Woesearchaeota archaeon]
MENLRIGIVGNIGVGKSTLIEAATKPPLDKVLLNCFPDARGKEKVHVFPEEFNPRVFDEFYKDPVKNAFMAQIEFFNGRLAREKKINECIGIILEDRVLAEDYYIFGQAQRVLGNMSAAEFLAYERNYRLMTEKTRCPDLVVYLRADVATLLKRIETRGRESEKSIPPAYLATLNTLYEEFVSRHLPCPVLTIDGNDERSLEEFLERTVWAIAEEVKGIDLRVTTPGISEWVLLPETAATLRAIDAERRLEDYLKQHPSLITIAGNVGLGKSTLAAVMQRSLRINGIYENPEENPLLEKFLADKAQHCFDLQLHFLEMRSAQRRLGKQGDASYVKDRSLPEDLLVFCHQFKEDNYLTASQLDLLTIAFRTAAASLPPADLMIVLQGSPDLAWKRIQQRGREMEVEGGWSKREIQSLARWYASYPEDVRKFGFHNGPVLELNVGQLDLTNRVHTGYIFEKVYEALSSSR